MGGSCGQCPAWSAAPGEKVPEALGKVSRAQGEVAGHWAASLRCAPWGRRLPGAASAPSQKISLASANIAASISTPEAAPSINQRNFETACQPRDAAISSTIARALTLSTSRHCSTEIMPRSWASSLRSSASSSSVFSTRSNMARSPRDQESWRLPLNTWANSENRAAACRSFDLPGAPAADRKGFPPRPWLS